MNNPVSGKPRLVMVGNGMAGMRAVEELLAMAPDHYDITVFGDEPHPNYNRILLSPVLAREMAFEDTILNDRAWYQAHGITLHAGQAVTRIDRARRLVHTADGTVAGYDRLLLALGSTPYVPDIPGTHLDGVMTYRTIEDVRTMHALPAGARAVVIGGGLLGLEAAYGLLTQGVEVTVVHRNPWLLDRQMDRVGAELLQKSLIARGLCLCLGAETEALYGDGHVQGLRLKDGRTLPADLVVFAVGIRPRTALAREAGLHCDRGIVVNDTLQTFDPRIYAVGECVQHRGLTYGLVAPLFEQAKVAANHLAQYGRLRYTGSLASTKLKVTGVGLFSAGDFVGGAGCEELSLLDPAGGVYKKVVIRDHKLAGVLLYGDTALGPWLFQLLRTGQDVSALRDHLLFGEVTGDVRHGGGRAIDHMPDTAEICGCNGISKGTIVHAIRTQGLFTVDDVRRHTKASASCGSCTDLVEQILASTLGGLYETTPQKRSLCTCTDLTHDEIRDAIVTRKLLSVRAVFAALEWKAEGGCPTCRPAVNYYVRCAWPAEATDDPQARFVNERVHANIQKDATYSVIPRMYGGVTTPAELKRIAEVAERYQVPMVKITGGQRIDLLGVKKQDLPAIWADLGMPSGHAYGKALRTCKSCVGTEFCRFGTQDSTHLAITLEKRLERMWSPHKVKLAASGCPRNCAESTIKDFGVIGVDSGWEIYVGGNGGMKLRAGDLLAKVASEDEVVEIAEAFMQLYRKEAYYLERTAPWIERVGLDHVKTAILENRETRKQLAAELRHALSQEKDPWAEALSGHITIHAQPLRIPELTT